MENQPKISPIEIINGIMIFGIIDGLQIFLVFIPPFWILSWLLGMLNWVTVFYLWFRKIKLTPMAISSLLESLPIVDVLPWGTFGWIVTVWINHHPSGSIAKIQKVTQALPKKIPTGGKPPVGKIETVTKTMLNKA